MSVSYRNPTSDYAFKSWIAKRAYHARRPGCMRLIDKANGYTPRGSRGTYTNLMRRDGFTAEQQADVWEAWKDMLRDEHLKSYYANRDIS